MNRSILIFLGLGCVRIHSAAAEVAFKSLGAIEAIYHDHARVRLCAVWEILPRSWENVRNLEILAGSLLLIVLCLLAREWSVERQLRRDRAVAAKVEQWRSEVLEDINSARPLPEIIEKVTRLLSYKLEGAPCWCELAGGETLGIRPEEATIRHLEIIQRQIPSHSGDALGTIFAALDPRGKARNTGSDALFNATQVAALAIETGGLYSDLVHRSEFDPLTDVHNRFSLEKRLDRLIEGQRHSDGAFGLIYIDLDDFKAVNDRYGHRTGDLFLQEAARRMIAQLRPADMLARIGGDEFAAIVPMVHSRSEVAEIAARLGHCFDRPFVLEETTISGSASVGIAVHPDDGADRDSLLSIADAAMYVAKNTRRLRTDAAAK